MIKTLKNLRIGVWSLIGIWCLGFGVFEAAASERGIGVSPAKIEIGEGVEWPHTIPITVTNFSSEAENFEVTFKKEEEMIVSVVPGRFLLGVGEVGRVLVVFEKPKRETQGLVKVAAIRTSSEGFTTGAGVKIPFEVGEEEDSRKFLAAAVVAFGNWNGLGRVFGIFAIFAAIISLWHVAAYARRFAKL